MQRLKELRHRLSPVIRRTERAISGSLSQIEQQSKTTLTQGFAKVEKRVSAEWNNREQYRQTGADGLQTLAKILLENQRRSPSIGIRAAMLFPDGKTTLAALSLVLRGVAEVLSQKTDLSWQPDDQGRLSYEKAVKGGSGTIRYSVVDPTQPDTPALATIEQFDPRAGAIHLIYCAQVAHLEQPWNTEFSLTERQLLDYTGLCKRTDLNRHQKLEILDSLVRQPAQVLAQINWFNQGKVKSFTTTDRQVWIIDVQQTLAVSADGDRKLTGLKVVGKPGEWSQHFLNRCKYYHTGIITKRTVQTLFSIGKQNAGAARILIWLTFQIRPGFQDRLIGKTLLEIAYGAERIAAATDDRQLRRRLADDFETDLNVVRRAGWQLELETGPDWLTAKPGKRPTGFWQQLLMTRWRFSLPSEAQERMVASERQAAAKPHPNRKRHLQPPSGSAIRQARKAKGWSRAFFASTMGKSVSWVDAIETGHRRVAEKDIAQLVEKLNLQLD